MEQYDAFSAGVESGGLIETTQIKALICYMLRKLEEPLSGEQIREILLEQGIANYFDVSEALSDLLRMGNISQEILEDGELLHLTQIGKEASRELSGDIPVSVREKALAAAVQMQTIARNARQTQIDVTPSGSGFEVSFQILAQGESLMHLSVYAADMQQVNRMKENFLRDPVKVYSGILAALIV